MNKSKLMIQQAQGIHQVVFMEPQISNSDFIEEVVGLVESNPKIKLILDFSKVDYISSAVIGKCIHVKNKVDEMKGQIALVNVKPPIVKVFEITKLDKVMNIQPSVATVVSAWN